MKVGSLGKVVFSVSSNKVETFSGLKISSSASFGSHKRHCGNEIIEFTGNDADSISFNMTISQILGVDVEEELEKLNQYKKTGKTLKFVIGKKVIGNYRWVITKISISPKQYGKKSEIITAEVSITLKEYNK